MRASRFTDIGGRPVIVSIAASVTPLAPNKD
jgi:hypothetical protein